MRSGSQPATWRRLVLVALSGAIALLVVAALLGGGESSSSRPLAWVGVTGAALVIGGVAFSIASRAGAGRRAALIAATAVVLLAVLGAGAIVALLSGL